MKPLACLFTCCCWPLWVAAAPAADDHVAQRQRIAAEQHAAAVRLAAALAHCEGLFATTACENAARAEHRTSSERLQREQQLLAADQRKRRAAERLARIEAKMRAPEAPKPASAARR